MRYPGGKNSDGVFQRIISQMPPHERYVEAFCGSAAVLRHKRPARQSWAIDLDPGALAMIRDAVPHGTHLVEEDAIAWIRARHAQRWWQPGDLLYLDPPYLLDTRRGGRIYRHELTDRDHDSLLDVLRRLPCMVLLSGYWSRRYTTVLADWRGISFRTQIRAGPATEWLWANYPEPAELHDYRYVGRDYREREKFRRQQRRWAARLADMGPLRRFALLAAIAETGEGP